MKTLKLDYEEPIIFCSHNLDLSNIKNLATDIATRLGVNINITQGFEDEILDTIKIPGATITKNLQGRDPKIDTDYDYALVHGDELHLFYANFMEYLLPASVDYLKVIDDLKNNPESNGDEDNSINELKKFGATEVHINSIEEVNPINDDKKDWSKLQNWLTNAKSHYLYKVV